MAPADTLSPPGSSSYSSNTLTVGDGTWDFTKNTFLLPNLVALNFDTMQYNGMGNRFSTLTQYHSLILGHGVLAAITFLFIIPIAVLVARFYARSPGTAIRYHAYLQILAVLFSTVIFILGFMAVGPPRNLSNPHHGIGVAIYVLILLQAVGGRLVKHITGRSLRVHLHKWSGRAITLLGIVQVPLGLTLYGSPKYLFVLYTLWMVFLLLLYFILDYRDEGRREVYVSGGRGTDHGSDRKSGRGIGWLGPLAAGAGAWALLRGRGRKRDRDTERALSRTPSPAGRSHRGPEVIPSPRASESYHDEKHTDRRRASGGGFMNRVLGVGAAVGAGAFVSRMMSRRSRGNDDQYSAVATDTPSRPQKPRRGYAPTESEFSERTEDIRRHDSRHDRRSPLLPGPGIPVAAGAAPSAAGERPRTPRPAHSRFDSQDASDYSSSYVSPSRRNSERKKSGGFAKGILGGLTLGFLGRKAKDRHDRNEEQRLREDEDRRREEEDRRAGNRTSRYTGDGYPTPTRTGSRRRPHRPGGGRPPPSGVTTTASGMSEESSIEPRGDTPYDPVPVSGVLPPHPIPLPGSAAAAAAAAASASRPGPIPLPGTAAAMAGGRPSRPSSRTRYDGIEPAAMPPMPVDPHGILHHESGSETYFSSGGRPHRRHSNRRGAGGDPEAAAAAAAASASVLAAQVEEEHRPRGRQGEGSSSRHPITSVKMKADDKGGMTFRRLTGEQSRQEQRRRRNDSLSSQSELDTPTSRRYRRERDSSQRQAEVAAEQQVENEPLAPLLSPPNPAFAQGRRAAGKDSAYYSGQPGPSGGMAGAVSSMGSLASPGGSHGTFSALSPTPSRDPTASAADRRRRRRLERRDGSRPANTVDFE
ncbi:hypothetical protein B0T24DRAFT_612062 [Lasiosphaeria ovina]|uniref:Cytochrome b561 domain-containing protein n=1 Tax=Lasiosphaeria ovina TaxID=92902 RepID=A0AAE0NDF5_9PEZI|nr:hypothetical protein B0T24DRAFT_612062 [Lasiosphaeria ovina]